MLEEHQQEMIQKNLELADADAKMKVIEAIAENNRKEAELTNQNALYKMQLEQQLKEDQFAKNEALRAKEREAEAARKKAEQDMQPILDAIKTAELSREKAESDANIEFMKQQAEIEKAKQDAYAATVAKIMESISPDLVAALSTKANADLLTEATKNMSAYSIARGESVANTVNTLLRGTTLENVIDKMAD